MRSLVAAAPLLVLSSCAARAMPASTTASSRAVSSAPAPGSAVQDTVATSSASGGASGAATGATYVGLSSAPSGRIQGVGGVAPDDDEAVQQWEDTLARARAGLAANVPEFRPICRAAGDVCAAAREICQLVTGPRCFRAQGSCGDASRRRDGACPVCPPR